MTLPFPLGFTFAAMESFLKGVLPLAGLHCSLVRAALVLVAWTLIQVLNKLCTWPFRVLNVEI